MPRPVLFSIVESPAHPDFSALYRRLDIADVRLASTRKAIAALKEWARVIVLVDRAERQYVDKLNDILPLHAVPLQPASATDLETALRT